MIDRRVKITKTQKISVRKKWSIAKVNAQFPDLNGGVVRLLLQMGKKDSPLIFVVRLLLQMVRLPLQNCIYYYKLCIYYYKFLSTKYSSRRAYRFPIKICNRKRTHEQLHFLKGQFARENAPSSDYHSDHILPLKSFGSIMTLSGSIREI